MPQVVPTENQYKYGTAGFRMNHKKLDQISERMGLFDSLITQGLKGKTIGIMITASHNPESDNGLKLIGPEDRVRTNRSEAPSSCSHEV